MGLFLTGRSTVVHTCKTVFKFIHFPLWSDSPCDTVPLGLQPQTSRGHRLASRLIMTSDMRSWWQALFKQILSHAGILSEMFLCVFRRLHPLRAAEGAVGFKLRSEAPRMGRFKQIHRALNVCKVLLHWSVLWHTYTCDIFSCPSGRTPQRLCGLMWFMQSKGTR